MDNLSELKTVGIVGVRGYVGRELIRLLAHHETLKVDWVSSRQLKGISLVTYLANNEYFEAVRFGGEHYYNSLIIEKVSEAEAASTNTDIIVLALPNGLAKPFVDALEATGKPRIILDLSADYRFDDDWVYSVPEIYLKSINSNQVNQNSFGKTTIQKISNPGCYATAMQLALAPLKRHIKGTSHCFGISGFSGAGTKPSANNDPKNLKDNILPYGLIEHLHEKEVAHHSATSISFSPHVAEFFRGISMTIQVDLIDAHTDNGLFDLFSDFYENDRLVVIQQTIPNVQQVVNKSSCIIGGFALSKDGKRLTLVSCLDNLLKGAASQALQNIEMVLGEKIK